ncbi:hypothetical protein RQM40_25615, partial [Citrobacter portucalensis]
MRKVHRPAPRASDAQLGVQADGLRPPLNYALGITKYSIVTNSNDSVTLRLMTEHDLAMLY